MVSVFVTSNKPLVLEETPSSTGEPTVAPHTAGEAAAREKIFSGDPSLLASSDADAIAHGFGRTEGPAGPTSGLVPDLLNRFAVGPLFTSVEVLRKNQI